MNFKTCFFLNPKPRVLQKGPSEEVFQKQLTAGLQESVSRYRFGIFFVQKFPWLLNMEP